MAIGRCLVLLTVANGAPVMLGTLLGKRGNWPVDGGLVCRDGRPLFGPTKTIRGLLASVCATGPAALLVKADFVTGVLFALCAMLGDLGSSFIKRRLGVESSAPVWGLDQGLEALCPLLVLRQRFDLQVADMLVISTVFLVLDCALSPLLYRLHIRQRQG